MEPFCIVKQKKNTEMELCCTFESNWFESNVTKTKIYVKVKSEIFLTSFRLLYWTKLNEHEQTWKTPKAVFCPTGFGADIWRWPAFTVSVTFLLSMFLCTLFYKKTRYPLSPQSFSIKMLFEPSKFLFGFSISDWGIGMFTIIVYNLSYLHWNLSTCRTHDTFLRFLSIKSK